MSKRNVGLIAAAGAAVIGVGLYSNTSRTADSSQAAPGRNRAQAKRDHGLSGAGVGGNMMSGGTELEASPGRPDKDPEQKVGTTAPPSGGIGGGEGVGGSSAQKMQIPTVGNQFSPSTPHNACVNRLTIVAELGTAIAFPAARSIGVYTRNRWSGREAYRG